LLHNRISFSSGRKIQLYQSSIEVKLEVVNLIILRDPPFEKGGNLRGEALFKSSEITGRESLFERG
jgi:hypothetical protein